MFSKLTRNYTLLIIAYTILYFIMYNVLYFFQIVDEYPNAINIVKCDAAYYESIKNIGYLFKENEASNSGFFPLFPYFWKYTTLSSVGISILNGLIYIVSLNILCKIIKPEPIVLGLYMSLPCLFIMFTPYTEPLFFLFSTGIIYGLIHKDNKILLISFLLASLTRASFLFFIPALLGVELMNKPFNDILKPYTWKSIQIWPYLVMILAVVIVGSIQYIQVDQFFAYYKMQSNVWGRNFNFPTIPFGRDSNSWIVKLSWLNLWVGLFISLIGLRYLYHWIIKDENIQSENKHILFSIIFLVMTFLSIVFFNPKWYWYHEGSYNGTILAGINRYLQANPFMLVFLVYIYNKTKSNVYFIILFILSTYITWLLIDYKFYDNIHSLRDVSTVSGFLLLYWIYYYYRWKSLGFTIILYSVFLQCMLFNFYMKNILTD